MCTGKSPACDARAKARKIPRRDEKQILLHPAFRAVPQIMCLLRHRARWLFLKKSHSAAVASRYSNCGTVAGDLQEADFIYIHSLNPANFRLFAGIFGHFSGKIPPFSGKNRSFPTGPIFHCGMLYAFPGTLKFFPETAFHSGMTRGLFTFVASFSSLRAH